MDIIELNKLTAYNKGNPNMLNLTPHPNNHVNHLLLLESLLSIGGQTVGIPQNGEEDIFQLLTRGQIWESDRRKYMKGQMSQCHMNSSLLWYENKDKSTIMTGYALIENKWVQHSWVIQIRPRKNLLIETTYPFEKYVGFAMTTKECNDFYFDNC